VLSSLHFSGQSSFSNKEILGKFKLSFLSLGLLVLVFFFFPLSASVIFKIKLFAKVGAAPKLSSSTSIVILSPSFSV
jgi:hypothetical protein